MGGQERACSSQSPAGFLAGSGTHKVSGHERLYRKNGRFHDGVLHWGKFAKNPSYR